MTDTSAMETETAQSLILSGLVGAVVGGVITIIGSHLTKKRVVEQEARRGIYVEFWVAQFQMLRLLGSKLSRVDTHSVFNDEDGEARWLGRWDHLDIESARGLPSPLNHVARSPECERYVAAFAALSLAASADVANQAADCMDITSVEGLRIQRRWLRPGMRKDLGLPNEQSRDDDTERISLASDDRTCSG